MGRSHLPAMAPKTKLAGSQQGWRNGMPPKKTKKTCLGHSLVSTRPFAHGAQKVGSGRFASGEPRENHLGHLNPRMNQLVYVDQDESPTSG